VAHLFFFNPHNFFNFVHKMWMLWESNWGLASKKLYILIITRILICEGYEFFSYWLKCTIIHFQRRSMILNFNYGMGSSHFLRILILSLWLWVISIMWSMFHGSPKKKKNILKKKKKIKKKKNKKKSFKNFFFFFFQYSYHNIIVDDRKKYNFKIKKKTNSFFEKK